jgi:hypothetical protein
VIGRTDDANRTDAMLPNPLQQVRTQHAIGMCCRAGVVWHDDRPVIE